MQLGKPFKRGRFDALPETPRVAHTYFDATSTWVDVDCEPFGRVRTHLKVVGDGPPLLLVHGLMTSSYSWRYVLEPLSKKFTVYAPDLVGAGETDKVLGVRYSATSVAKFVGAFQRAIDIVGCKVVGNSLGGYLCMQLALQNPESMSRLVNIHSPGLVELRLRALSLVMRIEAVRNGLAKWVRRDPERWAHANVHYYDESLKSREEARVYGTPLATEEGSAAFVHYLAHTLNPAELIEFEARLRACNGDFVVPLQMIYSRRDPMVPPRIGTALSKLLPKAEMVWLEDSSHFAHVDTPDALLSAMMPFLED